VDSEVPDLPLPDCPTPGPPDREADTVHRVGDCAIGVETRSAGSQPRAAAAARSCQSAQTRIECVAQSFAHHLQRGTVSTMQRPGARISDAAFCMYSCAEARLLPEDFRSGLDGHELCRDILKPRAPLEGQAEGGDSSTMSAPTA
jgi:hypothetical protein